MEAAEILRDYKGTDAYMTETARVIYNLFVEDLSNFEAFDTTLNSAYANNFLNQVVAAEQVVADTAIIDQQVALTEKADQSMEKARVKYNEVKYFVLKAFKSSLGTQNEFGLNDYERARKNRSQMAQFLFEMHAACVKYKTELINAGYNMPAIEAILPIREELLTTNTSQKLFIKQRPKLTEDRIIILNACYETLTQINAAAQLVFMNDYVKQNQYVYNPSPDTNDNLDFTGTVPANSVALISEVTYKPMALVRFRNTGLASLTFCLSASETIEGTTVELNGGAEVAYTMAELKVDGTNLLVRNNDLTKEGNYLVEVDY